MSSEKPQSAIMRKFRIACTAIVAVAAIGLAGCTSLVNLTSPKEQVEFAKGYIRLYQLRDFASIEADIDSSTKNSQLRAKLQQIADLFPNDESPTAINLLAWQIFKDFRSGIKTYEFTFQYDYSTRLVKVHVVLNQKDNKRFVRHVDGQIFTEPPPKVADGPQRAV
jgi:uncharacterized protein YceK